VTLGVGVGSTDTTERIGKTRSVEGDMGPALRPGENTSVELAAATEGDVGSSCIGDTTWCWLRSCCCCEGSASEFCCGSAMEECRSNCAIIYQRQFVDVGGGDALGERAGGSHCTVTP
jgi:hypothetical protein